jgi:ABC-type branched-subunit amino acid transport system substrate-binding protein
VAIVPGALASPDHAEGQSERLFGGAAMQSLLRSRVSKLALAGAIALEIHAWRCDQARADIIIGLAGPLSGQSSTFGAQMALGARQAVIDINAGGGVLGEKLVLLKVDDKGDPATGVKAAQGLAAKGVSFVIGHSIPPSAFLHPKSMPARAC